MIKIKVLMFIVVFCMLFSFVSWFFRPVSTNNSMINYESPNTVDVLFTGSSHMMNGINPNVIWREAGIASFNFVSHGQTLWTSYNFIVEALKNQMPKLVVVDALYAEAEFNVENGFTRNYENTYSTFNFSLNKLDMVWSGAVPEERISDMINLIFYHTRWKNIATNSRPYTESDYIQKNSYRFKGFQDDRITPIYAADPELNNTVYPATGEEGELPEKNRIYLQRIIDLSKEKDFELLLVAIPYIDGLDERMQKAFNSVRRISEENGIPFIDYHENNHREMMGFDYTTDMFDAGHLNGSGSEKLSKYAAAYIKTEYDIPDRRGDPVYKSWDESAEGYFRFETMQRAKLNTDLPSYVNALKDVDDLIIITGVKDEAAEKMEPINSQLSPFGITVNFKEKYRHSYISIYDVSSGYHYEEISPKLLEKNIYKDDLPINAEVFSGGLDVGNRAGIKIDGREYSKNQRGLNIVIYDKVLETVFDSFSVDTCGDETYAIKR